MYMTIDKNVLVLDQEDVKGKQHRLNRDAALILP